MPVKQKAGSATGMKKSILFLILAAILAFAAVAESSVDKNASGIELTEINMSGHPDWWPFMEKNGSAIEGIGPDVAVAVFEPFNTTVNCNYVGNWEQSLNLGKIGTIDGLVAAYKTREREKYFNYTIPYASDPVVLFFQNQTVLVYRDTNDLFGKRIVAMVGDSYGQELDDLLVQTANISLVRVDNPKSAFAMLENDSADYFIYSYWAGQRVIARENLEGFDNSTVVAEELFYMAISKKSPWASRMDEINASLEKLIQVGAVDEMIKATNTKLA